MFYNFPNSVLVLLTWLTSATLDLAYTAMGSFDIWWEGGCWEWDVAAGIAILEEAGGLITTANPPEDIETAEITRAHLGGRLYLAIRYVPKATPLLATY
jgi:myo-inositol-1(or 4)-monophosphatase